MISPALAQAINAPTTEAEVRLVLERPIGAEEREEVLALVRWFTRRYPTPAARLAYVRQAYTRWQRIASRSG